MEMDNDAGQQEHVDANHNSKIGNKGKEIKARDDANALKRRRESSEGLWFMSVLYLLLINS